VTARHRDVLLAMPCPCAVPAIRIGPDVRTHVTAVAAVTAIAAGHDDLGGRHGARPCGAESRFAALLAGPHFAPASGSDFLILGSERHSLLNVSPRA
jgi:hypothetical protein